MELKSFKTLLSKFQSKTEAKKKLAYFISYWEQHKIYYSNLLKDHEPDEISTQMCLYEQNLKIRAQFTMYADNGKLDIDLWPREVRDRKLHDTIRYAKQHRNINETEVFELYFTAYGKPANLEELMLKASLAGDNKLYEFLESYT